MTIYLCGPINGCTDEECKDWREYAKANLQDDTLDPMRRDYRGREDECVAEIVEGDKADIDASTCLLVNYDKPSVGTSMEILYAWERQIPVYIVAQPGTRISPWMRYHATAFFSTFAEAIARLNA